MIGTVVHRRNGKIISVKKDGVPMPIEDYDPDQIERERQECLRGPISEHAEERLATCTECVHKTEAGKCAMIGCVCMVAQFVTRPWNKCPVGKW